MRHGTHLCPMRVALLAVAMLAGAGVPDRVVGAIEARAGDP